MIKHKRVHGVVSTDRHERAALKWNLIRTWLNAPLVVLLGYGLLGLVILFGEGSMLRGLLAAVLALFGPGYALMAVLFPRRNALDAVERGALAGGLSLAVGGVSGFFLTFSPWGLSLGPVLAVGVLFSLGCLVLVWARQWRLAGSEMTEEETGPAREARWQQWWAGQGRASQWVTIGLAALMVAGAAALGWGLMVPATDRPMTEFYVLNNEGQAGAYPTVIVAGQPLPIEFGVQNRETELANYAVEAQMAGEVLDASGPIALRPGETWLGELRLVLPPEEAAAGLDAGVVEFVLERNGQPYRTLHLWLAVEDDGLAADAAAQALPVVPGN